jgi:hypothetical protein
MQAAKIATVRSSLAAFASESELRKSWAQAAASTGAIGATK